MSPLAIFQSFQVFDNRTGLVFLIFVTELKFFVARTLNMLGIHICCEGKYRSRRLQEPAESILIETKFFKR